MPTEPSKWGILSVVALGVFMATLDTSIVNISLPAIARHFAVPLGGALSWIVIAYLVVLAATLLIAGRLADLFGQRAVWIGGLITFTLSSCLCGVAPSLAALIGARAVQGLGGAMLMAISPAMLTRAFPPEERGRALGLNAIFVGLGVSAGPTLGGLLTERLSWRWIFFVNVPFGALAVLVSWRVLAGRFASRVPARFDLPGATLLGVGLAGVTGGLSFGEELGWLSAPVVAALAVGFAALVLFVPFERRQREPVVDTSIFHDRVFASSALALVLSFLGLFAISFLMPFYLEQLRGFSTERAGLTMTALPVTIAVVSPISGAIADRVGSRPLCIAGMTLAALGLVLLSRIGVSTPVHQIVIVLILIGAGQALFQPANNSALMGSAPRERQGVASGILATARVVGQSLSVAVIGAIFAGFGAARAGHALDAGTPVHELVPVFLQGFRAATLACASLALFAAVASVFRGRESTAARRSSGPLLRREP